LLLLLFYAAINRAIIGKCERARRLNDAHLAFDGAASRVADPTRRSNLLVISKETNPSFPLVGSGRTHATITL
jgi:hypothetical protein